MAEFEHRLAGTAGALTRHGPASGHAREVAGAAAGPANERLAGAKAAQVGDMATAPVAGFDRAGFLAAVEAAVAKRTPSTLAEADDLAGSGAMASVRAEIAAQTTGATGAATGPVEQATEAPADPSRGSEKPVAPLPPASPAPQPGPVGAAAAMPSIRPPAATDLDAEPQATAATMAEADVTEEQLADSEEPAFLDALEAKRAGDAHSGTAAAPVRAEEAQILTSARAGADQDEQAGMASLTASRRAADAGVQADKLGGKSRDEQARQAVANAIEEIHSRAQTETSALLSGLDRKVDDEFTKGEAAARQLFESTHRRDMAAWKDRRYGGLGGAIRWAQDKIFDPPPEADRIFTRARALYLAEIRKVVGRIADVIAADLTAAKHRIAAGRREVSDYVASLPRQLRSVGGELSESVQARFDQLDADVEAKQGDLVQAVAGRYGEAAGQVDARIEELQAANRGLWGAAKAKIAGVIDTIRGLRDALTSALKGAAAAVATIIASPKRFFDNLLGALGQGLQGFVANIGSHLKKGLFGWLTGAVGEAGITVPETFDLKGIIGLVLQVLGMTWANIRSRIVKRLGPLGDKAIGGIEQGLSIISALASQGPIALWSLIAAKVTNLWDLVVGKLQDFLVTRVITAGITWLIGLLNPVAGFVKICKAIVDLIGWFWNNAGRLVGLLKAITGSILAIAKGSVGSAATAIEGALSRTLPVVIGFLASLLGLGGLGQKVRELITAVRRPVTKVIDTMVGKAVAVGKRFLRSPLGRKLVGGVRKGVAFGRRKLSQAKSFGDRAVQATKRRVYGGDDTPEGKQRREELALAAGLRAVNAYAGRPVRRLTLEPRLKAIQLRRGVGHLGVKPAGDYWAVEARVDRATRIGEAKRPRAEQETSDEATSESDAVDRVITTDDLSPLAGYRPSWRSSTKKELASGEGPYAHLHTGVRTRLQADLDRRHIQAAEDIKTSLIGQIVGSTLREAVITLNNLGHPPARETMASIIASMRAVLRDRFNDYENLWVGPRAENQEKGREIGRLKQALEAKEAERQRRQDGGQPTDQLDAEIEQMRHELDEARLDPEQYS